MYGTNLTGSLINLLSAACSLYLCTAGPLKYLGCVKGRLRVFPLIDVLLF